MYLDNFVIDDSFEEKETHCFVFALSYLTRCEFSLGCIDFCVLMEFALF